MVVLWTLFNRLQYEAFVHSNTSLFVVDIQYKLGIFFTLLHEKYFLLSKYIY